MIGSLKYSVSCTVCPGRNFLQTAVYHTCLLGRTVELQLCCFVPVLHDEHLPYYFFTILLCGVYLCLPHGFALLSFVFLSVII